MTPMAQKIESLDDLLVIQRVRRQRTERGLRRLIKKRYVALTTTRRTWMSRTLRALRFNLTQRPATP